MVLEKFRVSNFRILREVSISLIPTINAFQGANGAGKTSILEAIDFLSRGRSFRSNRAESLITREQKELLVSAETLSKDQLAHRFGVKRSSSELVLHKDSEPSTLREFARYLPVQSFHPETYLLISGGPAERRKYIDWGAFHVEPSFAEHWLKFKKSLAQRNLALRTGDWRSADAWVDALAEHGERITEYRAAYVKEILPYARDQLGALGFDFPLTLQLKRGWPEDKTLKNCIEKNSDYDQKKGSTQYGPQRAELKIDIGPSLSANMGSRGQQKILAIALKLAQTRHLQMANGLASIYLFDELPAELDASRRRNLLQILAGLEAQIFISSVSKELVERELEQEVKWFHVEQGEVDEMV